MLEFPEMSIAFAADCGRMTGNPEVGTWPRTPETVFWPRPNRVCQNPRFQPLPAVLKTRSLVSLNLWSDAVPKSTVSGTQPNVFPSDSYRKVGQIVQSSTVSIYPNSVCWVTWTDCRSNKGYGAKRALRLNFVPHVDRNAGTTRMIMIIGLQTQRSLPDGPGARMISDESLAGLDD